MKINLTGKNFKGVIIDSLGVRYVCHGDLKVDRCNAEKLNTLKQELSCSHFELFVGCDYLKLDVENVDNDNLNVRCDSLDMYEMKDMPSFRIKALRNEIKAQLNLEDLEYIDLSEYDFL